MSRLKTIFGALLIAVLCMGMGVAVYAADTGDVLLTSVTIVNGNVTATVPAGGSANVYAVKKGDAYMLNGLQPDINTKYYVNSSTSVTIDGKAASYVGDDGDDGYPLFRVGSDSSDKKDDDDDDEDHEPPSWVKNPNQKPALVMSAPAIGGGATLGWQEQGDLGKLVFSMARPAGWSEAFSFNMLKGGKPDYSLKSGTMQLYIPHEYLKTGRIYAIIGIDKNGNAVVFNDVDTNPLTITVNLNIEGYAFDLIYTN